MYLPQEIASAEVLIAVKTYPLPSGKYEELVCTAGFLPDGKWIRLYPIPFRALPYKDQYNKFQWITLDVVHNSSDFRPESYRPRHGIDTIQMGNKIETDNHWARRKEYALKEVFTSMEDLIQLAKGPERKSLATLKPAEIIDFVVEPTEREWKQEWKDQLLQMNLFDRNEQGEGRPRRVLPKLPYKYSYKFFTDGDKKPRKLMIEDWEIGALYWNCYRKTQNEAEANKQVRKKFFDEFCTKHDLHLFLGTSLKYHMISLNPFMIIGIFYPLKPQKRAKPNIPPSTFDPQGIQQPGLFDS